jgi:hypothetical protein
MPEVPEQLKKDNFAFYVLARSHAPDVMIPNVRKLVSSLIATMKLIDNHEYELQLNKARNLAKEAWFLYSEQKQWGRATQAAEDSMDEVSFLIYDNRFCTTMQNSFVGRKVE